MVSGLIDESRSDWTVRSNATLLVLANTLGAIDASAFAAKLEKEKLDQITSVQISRSSLLEVPFFIPMMPNLETLVVDGKKLRSMTPIKEWQKPNCLIWEKVYSCRNVDASALSTCPIKRLTIDGRDKSIIDVLSKREMFHALILENFGERTFDSLEHSSVDDLSIFGGKLQHLSSSRQNKFKKVFLSGLQLLASVSGLRCNILKIEKCLNLDVATLRETSDVRILELSLPKLTDLEMLRDFRLLESLSILLPPIDLDLAPLASLEKLKCVWVNTIDTGLLPNFKELSRRSNAVICTGNFCVSNGTIVERSKYYSEEQRCRSTWTPKN